MSTFARCIGRCGTRYGKQPYRREHVVAAVVVVAVVFTSRS